MKHYFVKWGSFGNTYALCWVEAGSTEEQSVIRDGWERITRREAERLAREERYRQKTDPAFSGYADTYIAPYGMERWESGGIVLEKWQCRKIEE